MPMYVALTYTADVDWSQPEQAAELAEYREFRRARGRCCGEARRSTRPRPPRLCGSQVALALRTLGGLTTAEVARGLLVPEATMAKRLTRAKQKITQARIPYRVPEAE
ncbi:sigma factor-like helix-turn-helix DNA-binding protein [Micromonospora sp. NPDC006431]|uniref:sigma factor-like helix-turn-helix DNA-binding protein n=1 Tax=Micromonospora sp. NPDC006431 TaxID=3364235 RepID=UPI003679D047